MRSRKSSNGIHRKKPEAKKRRPRIEVRDASGKLLFRGRERRKRQEQVFFDSTEGIRRFSLDPKKIRKNRIKELEKTAPQKKVLGKTTFPSTRRTKFKVKKI
jgi:hypothetical protein